jgi:hypothetical protein
VSAAAIKREPFLDTLSKNVSVAYGYKDGHAAVKVRTPVGLWVSVDVQIVDIAKVKNHFDLAWGWRGLTEQERKGQESIEVQLRSDAKVRYKYQDLHVELGIWRVVWIWLTFPDGEFALAKKAFDNANGWASLPEDVRNLQGV